MTDRRDGGGVEPNAEQRAIIENTEGIYCVDAGAGTGKTFAITRRYANVVEQDGVEPDDVLLVTFTNNAATEMRERVVARSSYGMRELGDAPIQTFHSLCHDVLSEHGFDAPSLLGIDDGIADATRLLDDELVEAELFREFLGGFSADHPEYDDLFRAVSDPAELLDLIKRLAAKGVFPTADGWYRNGESHLDGDFAAFRAAFDEANEPRNGGRKQSRLRAKLGRYGKDECYLPEAPERSELRGEGTKAVPAGVARTAFEEDREELKAFVHDVYFEYLEFALRRNYLNFAFLQLFAFVLLCEDHQVREALSFEYVVIDEFQDSSEIQFKLGLLLCGSGNLCVVGDWKQSIFSFQYAAVENITHFAERLERFAAELNDDRERVSFAVRPIEEIELVENYRSTQSILDFAERGLLVPASNDDPLDAESVRERIVSLRSNSAYDRSRIEAIRHEEEPAAVLTKVQEIVGNDEYAVEDDGELRPPEYGDVAVLTRTRDFGRDLLHVAEECGLPMAYDGGIELFRTDQAKLVLAWLRIVEDDVDRGWAVVLERAGYALEEIRHVLDREAYPETMIEFRAELAATESLGAVVGLVLSRYGYDGGYGNALLASIRAVHDATTMTRGDLIRFLEQSIEEGTTSEVHASAGADAVTVQTIHAAKGLEHPIVVLANMNRHKFPSSGGRGGTITFDETIGLRQRRVYAEAHGHPHLYDNWRMDVLPRCLPDGKDEERRLLYVAMTRAESHLLFSAGEHPNTFLEELPVDVEELVPAVDEVGSRKTEQTTLQASVPVPEGPVGWNPHSLMSDAVFEDVTDGEGTEFGTRVHEFAEAYASEEAVEPPDDGRPDWEHVMKFVDGLAGELHLEQEAMLPLDVDGGTVAISGIVDLVCVGEDAVTVVDFKTDRGRHAEEEYGKQLSVYYHVLDAWYPRLDVSAAIFYTYEGETRRIEPLSKEELARLVRELREEENPVSD